MHLIGAALVSLAFVSLWWGLSGARAQPIQLLAHGFTATRPRLNAGAVTDARKALLAKDARDRAIGPLLESLAQRARRLTPAGIVESLERRMLVAGVPLSWTVERLVAVKLVLGVGALFVGLLRIVVDLSTLNLLIVVGAPLLGYFSVDLALHSQAEKRQAEVGAKLADTIDQITVSVEAGLGLEAAIARAAKSGDGPLAEELLRTLQDVQAGMPRSAALRALIERTTVADLRRFVQAVVQAEAYGVPVGQVLRVQAGELRVKRRQRAEEKAMKMPVKVLFPLVLCIMPAMFIVLLGPAGLRIMDTL